MLRASATLAGEVVLRTTADNYSFDRSKLY
jgi:hypothetical protein